MFILLLVLRPTSGADPCKSCATKVSVSSHVPVVFCFEGPVSLVSSIVSVSYTLPISSFTEVPELCEDRPERNISFSADCSRVSPSH